MPKECILKLLEILENIKYFISLFMLSHEDQKYYNFYWLDPMCCFCHWLCSTYSYNFRKHSPNFNFLIPL